MFKFNPTDFGLCDGKKKDAMLLRDRMLVLYNELTPKLEADPFLRTFVKPSKLHNKLSTQSPYVPTITEGRRGEGYKKGSWVGFADSVSFPVPQIGMQFQYGISGNRIWYGIWIQGDKKTRKTQRSLWDLLRKRPEQITSTINSLGNRFWFEVTRDEDDEEIINNVADRVTFNQVKQFVANLEHNRLWISLHKKLSRDELLSLNDVSSDIIKTTHELLEVYRCWCGIKPRGMTEDEAYEFLNTVGKLQISDEEGDQVITGEHKPLGKYEIIKAAIISVLADNYPNPMTYEDIQKRVHQIIPSGILSPDSKTCIHNDWGQSEWQHEIRRGTTDQLPKEGKIAYDKDTKKYSLTNLGKLHALDEASSNDEGFNRKAAKLTPSKEGLLKLIALADDQGSSERVTRSISAQKRNVNLAKLMKMKYDFKCQFCGFTFKQRNGNYYVEEAHIDGLASKGPDTSGNILILCPNHHKMFDLADRTTVSRSKESVVFLINGERFEAKF